MAKEVESYNRVIIELRNSDLYEGNLLRNSSKSIELDNIFCHATNTTYDGSMTFYRNEVASVSRVSNSKTAQSDQSEKPLCNGESFDSVRKIAMDCDEFNRLKDMTYNFIFIDTFSTQFESAVEVLSNRESIAVVGLGNTFRGKGLSLLLMADFKQIYIFDMLCLVHLKSLKEILESRFICKVVHDGSVLYDSLFHKYKVQMDNVFDTKIVDQTISKQENEDVQRNISQCLTHYFNFPPSLLAAAMDDMADKSWADRPVHKSNKIKAGQLVAYLLSLRDTLMSQILKPYTSAIQTNYLQLKNASGCELLKFES